MNYTPQLLDILARSRDDRELFLAPHAVPMRRRAGELLPAAEQPLTDRDIHDTLVALRAQAGGGAASLGKEGSFSFGVAGMGRFRVWYLTQRGSYIVALFKVPFEPPALSELAADPSVARQAETRFAACRRGLLIVSGASLLDADLVVYALLKWLSEHHARVIFVVEMSTLFLLKHHRSIVVQCEMGTDLASIDQGIRIGFSLNADLLFVRDVAAREDFERLRKAAHMGVFVVATMSPLDVDDFVLARERPAGTGALLDVWRVEKQERGQLELYFHP